MYPPMTQFQTLDAAARRQAVHLRDLELARDDRSARPRVPRARRLKPVLRSLTLSR